MSAEHVSVTTLLERDELLDALDSAGNAGGRLVFVGGEAGVGKTALVRAFEARTSLPVLRGSCENLATPTPLGPFVDLAAEAGGALADVLAERPEPRMVARALLAELTRPAVAVIEDVHWADEATLDALRVLGRRIDGTPGLVIATYRDDEVESGHPLRAVLGELASAPGVSRLSVPPLSLDAVRRARRAARRRRGRDPRADRRATRSTSPRSSRSATRRCPRRSGTPCWPARRRCEDAARRLLDVVALVPGRTELWLLEAVAPDDAEHLDACLAAGMLREDGEAVAFRHELARIALESTVPAGRRRTAARAAPGCAAHAGAPLRRTSHGSPTTPSVRETRRRARVRARRGTSAPRRRQRTGRRRSSTHARCGSPAGSTRDDRADLLDLYALEAQLTGLSAEAADAWQEAAGLYRAVGDRLAEGRSLAWLTRACIPIGRNAEAETASRAAIEVLESVEPGPELARAYAAQAYVRMLNRDNADGVAWGKRSAALAERLGDVDTLAYALNMIGTSYVMAGEIETGVEYLQRSLTIAREHDLWLWVGPALSMLGSGLGEMYEFERSERYLQRAHRPHRRARPVAVLLARMARARRGVHRPLGRGDRDRPGRARAKATTRSAGSAR